MSNQDQIMNDILNIKSKFQGKKQEISDIRKSMHNIDIRETNKWNTFINNSVPHSFQVQPKINAINELKFMSKLISEFNDIYSEKGGLVSMYFEGKLNLVYSCAATILERFHILQKEGIEMTNSSHNRLENLLMIMEKIILEFKKLFDRSHCMYAEELKKAAAFEQSNRESYITKEKQKMRDEETRLNLIRQRQTEDKLIIQRQDKFNGENENLPTKDISENNEQKSSTGIIKNIANHVNRDKSENNVRFAFEEGGVETNYRSEDNESDHSGSNEPVEEVFKDMWLSNKEYCHNIRKTVNNMCSQITSENPKHTIERLQKILSFLRGKAISLVGTDNRKQISLKEHPDAVELFWYLFYRAVLIQAESQFTANIETTIAFASFAVALFGEYPDRLNDLLRVIVDQYPVFVGESSALNDDDQYILELKGVARLVAALAVALPPPNFRRPDSFSGVQLWTLLAGMEAAPVQVSVSAEAINGLLEVGGNSLWRIYGVQFQKMLLALKKKFEAESGISEIALVLLIDDAVAKKKFDVEGFLSAQSWK